MNHPTAETAREQGETRVPIAAVVWGKRPWTDIRRFKSRNQSGRLRKVMDLDWSGWHRSS